MMEGGYSSNEWYTIIQNWKNQKYYAPNITQQSQSLSSVSTSNLSSIVTSILTGDDSSKLDIDKDNDSSIDSNKDNGGNDSSTSLTDKDGIIPSSTPIITTISGSNINQQQQQQQDSASYIIIEALLKALKNERDDILRINLLLFLQDNSSILLEDDLKRFERVFSILQSLIFSQTDSYPVKSQVLTTITSILICESLIKTNPKFIEIFIELLLDIISKINNSPDRLLRGSACNCLLEFELTYPCLLSEFRQLIMNYCQQENTHLIQNYTMLLSTILQNVTLSAYEDANTLQNTIILNGGGGGNTNSTVGTTTGTTTATGTSSLSSNNTSLGSLLGAIISPTSNTLSLPISSTMVQTQTQQQSQHSSLRSITTTASLSQHASSNNLNNLVNAGSNSSQNSINYGSSRRSALLPLPNIFTDSIDPSLRSTSFAIPLNVKFSPISLERINNTNELFQRSLSSTNLNNIGNGNNNSNKVKLSESFEKDIFKCASAIADQSAYLNQWGLVTVIQQLIPLIDLVSIPHNFFKNHLHLLYKLFFTNNTVQFHIVLYLTLIFPDLYSQDELDYCLKRLISIINDISLSLENRILSMDWLLSLPYKVKNGGQLSIFQFYPNFYPTSFDNIQLKEAKLYSLCKCLTNTGMQGLIISPEELLKSLVCLEEFKHNSETSLSTIIVFSNLLLFLTNFPNLMFSCVEKYLSEILINYPQFLNVVISLLNGIYNNQVIKIQLFLSLSKTIVQLKPLRFLQYLPLVERVVVEDQIDPTGLLEKVFELLKRKKICNSGNWFIGNIILSICRRTLMYHNLPIVSKPLKLILSNLFSYFSNLEIRDRASFYQRLISHLPDDKIKTILNTLQSDHEANVSGLLSSSSTVSDKNKLIKSVPNFISISQILNRDISNSMKPTSIYDQPILKDLDNEFEYDFQNYLSILMDPIKLEAKIIIPYQIRYKKHNNNNNNNNNNGSSSNLNNIGSNNGIPLKVYALLIQLQQSPYYSPIHPIRIPYLCHPNNDLLDILLDGNGNIELQQQQIESKLKEFPYCYDIDLSFIPIYPIPTSFSIKMIFNDDEGKTCKSDGSLISIQLENLFMNNPIPHNLKSNSIIDFQFGLFDKLWSNNENSNNNNNNNPIPMTNSVKQINISKSLIKEIINLKLSNFIIKQKVVEKKLEKEENEKESKKDDEIEIVKLLIFLPPQFHLLLKFEIGQDSTIIYIKTDYWRCLVYLDQYLSNLVTTTTNSIMINNNNNNSNNSNNNNE